MIFLCYHILEKYPINVSECLLSYLVFLFALKEKSALYLSYSGLNWGLCVFSCSKFTWRHHTLTLIILKDSCHHLSVPIIVTCWMQFDVVTHLHSSIHQELSSAYINPIVLLLLSSSDELVECLCDLKPVVDLNTVCITLDVICLSLPLEEDLSESIKRPCYQRMTSHTSQISSNSNTCAEYGLDTDEYISITGDGG